jgi:hypothetical protein
MTDFNVPSSPADQTKLNNMVEEAVDSHIRSSAEKNLRSDIATRAKEELALKTSDFNALVNERFEEKSTKAIEKHEAIAELNELLKNNCNRSSSDDSAPVSS